MSNMHLVLCILSIFILSSCSDGFRGYFKRSSNNKLFDTHGFQGGKRPPLYNQKYIAKAKRNISMEDLEEDEYDAEDVEFKVPSRVYQRMYAEMLAAERERRRDFNRRAPHLKDYGYYDDYPALHEAGSRAAAVASPDQKALQKEMREIKSMLKQTQEDLTKHKCSGVSSIDDKDFKKPDPAKKHIRTNLQKRFIDLEKEKAV
jgi:hypothetical protein